MHLLLAMLCAAGFTQSAAHQAALEGVRLVQQHQPYGVRRWLLYQSADPLRAVHGRAGVDAVVVETPYERVRYEAFLDALQGYPVSAAMTERMWREARDRVGFLVYAHSRSEFDRGFLSAFRPAVIALGDGQAVHDDGVVRFGPSDDFYDVGTFREQRWVGSITYRFPVRSCTERGAVEFADGYGKRYDFSFDLRRYR